MARPIAVAADGYADRCTRRPNSSLSMRAMIGSELAPILRRKALLFERHVEKHGIEVVAAEPRMTARSDDVVRAPAHAHERGVERAAAEIVDHDVLALGGDRVSISVRVLDTRRRR